MGSVLEACLAGPRRLGISERRARQTALIAGWALGWALGWAGAAWAGPRQERSSPGTELGRFLDERLGVLDLQCLGRDPFASSRAVLVLEFDAGSEHPPFSVQVDGRLLRPRGWFGEYLLQWETVVQAAGDEMARERLRGIHRVGDLERLGRPTVSVRHRLGAGESPLHVLMTVNGRMGLQWFSGAAGEERGNTEGWETPYVDASSGKERMRTWSEDRLQPRWVSPPAAIQAAFDEPIRRIGIFPEGVDPAFAGGEERMTFAFVRHPDDGEIVASVPLSALEAGGVAWADLAAGAADDRSARILARVVRVGDLQAFDGVRLRCPGMGGAKTLPASVMLTVNARCTTGWFLAPRAAPSGAGAEQDVEYADASAGRSRMKLWEREWDKFEKKEGRLDEPLRFVHVQVSPASVEISALRFEFCGGGPKTLRAAVPRAAMREDRREYWIPWEAVAAGAEGEGRDALADLTTLRGLLEYGRLNVQIVAASEDSKMPDAVWVGLNGHVEFAWFMGARSGQRVEGGTCVADYRDERWGGQWRLVHWAMQPLHRVRVQRKLSASLGLLWFAVGLAVIGERFLVRHARFRKLWASAAMGAMTAFAATRFLQPRETLLDREYGFSAMALFAAMGALLSLFEASWAWAWGRRDPAARASWRGLLVGAFTGGLLGCAAVPHDGPLWAAAAVGAFLGGGGALAADRLKIPEMISAAWAKPARRRRWGFVAAGVGALLPVLLAWPAEIPLESLWVVIPLVTVGLFQISWTLWGALDRRFLTGVAAALAVFGVWFGILHVPRRSAVSAIMNCPVDRLNYATLTRVTDPGRVEHSLFLGLGTATGLSARRYRPVREIPNNLLDEDGIAGDLRLPADLDPPAAAAGPRPAVAASPGVVWISVEGFPSEAAFSPSLPQRAPALRDLLGKSTLFPEQYVASPDVELSIASALGGGFRLGRWARQGRKDSPLYAFRRRGGFVFVAGAFELFEDAYEDAIDDWRYFDEDESSAYGPWLGHYMGRLAPSGRPFLHFVHLRFAANSCGGEAAPCAGEPPHDPIGCALAELDRHVGRILEVISAHGLTDRTAVVIHSSTARAAPRAGEPDGRAGVLERDLRGMLAIRLPGPSGGRTVSGPVSSLDVLPTLLDWAGMDPPAGTQGRSLLAATAGSGVPAGAVMGIACHPSPFQVRGVNELQVLKTYAIENGRKVVLDHFLGFLDVYDLDQDPGESRNLFSPHFQENEFANLWGHVSEDDRRAESLMERALYRSGLPDRFPDPPRGRGPGSAHPPLPKLP